MKIIVLYEKNVGIFILTGSDPVEKNKKIKK